MVITGPSGSGKSSLAFDTIYAEGQRRYVESLSVHARQHLAQMPKPDVDLIDGLSPAISVRRGRSQPESALDGRHAHRDRRSAAAAVRTARARRTVRAAAARSRRIPVPQMVDRVLAHAAGTRFSVRAPLALPPAGDARRPSCRACAARASCARSSTTGSSICRVEARSFAVGRALARERVRSRSTWTGCRSSRGALAPRRLDRARAARRATASCASRSRVARSCARPTAGLCTGCGYELGEITPASLSFNSPRGACEACSGLGERMRFDPGARRPGPEPQPARGRDRGLGHAGGPLSTRACSRRCSAALEPTSTSRSRRCRRARASASCTATAKTKTRQLRGRAAGPRAPPAGVGAETRRRGERRVARGRARARTCSATAARSAADRGSNERALRCGCSARTSTSSARSRSASSRLARAASLLAGAAPGGRADRARAARAARRAASTWARLSERGARRAAACRAARPSASGSRRSSAPGCAACSTCSTSRPPGCTRATPSACCGTLLALRDRGNTVLVVEHDLDLIAAADYVIDWGGRGRAGGRVIASGTPQQVAAGDSPTAPLSRGPGALRARGAQARAPARGAIRIRNARTHNLQAVDADVPLSALTVVSGVSGSGKSSLVMHTLLPAAQAALRGEPPQVPAEVEGLAAFARVVHVDQSPIGRSRARRRRRTRGCSRGIRELFAGAARGARARLRRPSASASTSRAAAARPARARAWCACRCSSCPTCSCPARPAAAVATSARRSRCATAASTSPSVLRASVDEASELFGALPKLGEELASLRDVGLGYLRARARARPRSRPARRSACGSRASSRGATTAHALYALDEPTTGLHPSEVELLLDVLDGLLARGHTVVVVEHNLELIRRADHVIDLGPEAGAQGGHGARGRHSRRGRAVCAVAYRALSRGRARLAMRVDARRRAHVGCCLRCRSGKTSSPSVKRYLIIAAVAVARVCSRSAPASAETRRRRAAAARPDPLARAPLTTPPAGRSASVRTRPRP